jgi:hypothetical protein
MWNVKLLRLYNVTIIVLHLGKLLVIQVTLLDSLRSNKVGVNNDVNY